MACRGTVRRHDGSAAESLDGQYRLLDARPRARTPRGYGLVRSMASLCGTTRSEEFRIATLLSVEDAAAELGTPVRFVRRLVHDRRIRFQKIGKYVRIDPEAL